MHRKLIDIHQRVVIHIGGTLVVVCNDQRPYPLRLLVFVSKFVISWLEVHKPHAEAFL